MNKNSLITPAISFQKNICRTCLCKITAEDSTPIFSDEEFVNGQSLRQVFVEVTCTLIDPLEKLPGSMCRECVEKLKNAVNFKRGIEKADKTLRSKLRLAELSFHMGRADSIESMLDSFCDEIYSTVNNNKIHNITPKCENINNNANQENNNTPNKNSIKIVNQTNKDNATLTRNVNSKKKSSDFKNFSGKDFIEDFLNQQDTRHKPIEDLSIELSNCTKVYSNKNKSSNISESEQNQYILIVQEVPDLIKDELIINAPEFIEDEVILLENKAEIIEIPDSPIPSVLQADCDTTSSNTLVKQNDFDPVIHIPIINNHSSSDDQLAAEMAWIENNLEDLGTLTEDNMIGCNKCDKRFTVRCFIL
ncbi:hypothetical protein ILUMI_17448 [Ignelater luminosus]|uniref:ZAD domain-containing protein n=1 Tax=Ignelater luminosus TaxID=2038154 RepID=A0A8K0CK34_IGNLU|nr:hypothetical protein ILUMI_17448 [Ignelater luminosus]